MVCKNKLWWDLNVFYDIRWLFSGPHSVSLLLQDVLASWWQKWCCGNWWILQSLQSSNHSSPRYYMPSLLIIPLTNDAAGTNGSFHLCYMYFMSYVKLTIKSLSLIWPVVQLPSTLKTLNISVAADVKFLPRFPWQNLLCLYWREKACLMDWWSYVTKIQF